VIISKKNWLLFLNYLVSDQLWTYGIYTHISRPLVEKFQTRAERNLCLLWWVDWEVEWRKSKWHIPWPLLRRQFNAQASGPPINVLGKSLQCTPDVNAWDFISRNFMTKLYSNSPWKIQAAFPFSGNFVAEFQFHSNNSKRTHNFTFKEGFDISVCVEMLHKIWYLVSPILIVDTNHQPQCSVTNTKCSPNIVCHSL